MGLDIARGRWPMYMLLALSMLLTITLLNKWSYEDELKNHISEVTEQLQVCSKLKVACSMERYSFESKLQEFENKLKDLGVENTKLDESVLNVKQTLIQKEGEVNRTQLDLDNCNTELKSLKNLEESKDTMLDTMRLEKETLTSQLTEKKEQVKVLENELIDLKKKFELNSPALVASIAKTSTAKTLHSPGNMEQSVLGKPKDEDMPNDNNALEEIDNNPNIDNEE